MTEYYCETMPTSFIRSQARSQPSDKGRDRFPKILDLSQDLKIEVPSDCLRKPRFLK